MLVGLKVSVEELHSINVVYADELGSHSEQQPLRRNPTIPAPAEVVGFYSLPELANIEYHIFGEELF